MRHVVLVLVVLAGVGCKRKNPAVCCTSPADCDSIGIRETESLCDPGFVCIDHRCTTAPDAPAAPPCESDEDCSAPTAYCSDERICVECLRSEHCGPIEPVCDAMHSCRECRDDNECASSVCDHATGACVSEAAILYASPSGGAQATCARTDACNLSRAVALADASRRFIKMAEGNYTTALLIDKPLFVHGHGAVLNAPPGANQTAIRLESGADLQVFGLSIINANVEGVGLRCQPAQTSSLPALTLDGVAIDSTNSTVVAQGCSATIVRGRLRTRKSTSPAVLVAPTSTMLIERSILDGGDGVWGEGANSVVRITNSVIKNQTGSDGAFIGSDLFGAGAGSVVVSFSTVINSQVKCGSGVPRCAGGTAAGSCIENTIIYNALPSAPTDTVQPGGCTASYSLIYPQSTPVPGNENKLGVNPQFADFAAGDYHLTSTSSAIDAADPGANNMVDFDGTSRPQGTRSDIGAFEYKP